MSTWWLVTWTTYGTWLPGDPRGYRTWRGRISVPPPRRFARPGEPVYNPSDHAVKHSLAKADTGQPVVLSTDEQQLALDALVEEIALLPVRPAILSLGATHAHWLAAFGRLGIRPTVARIKAAATRRLHARGFERKTPWTKNCDMKSKPTEKDARAAYEYVRRHAEQGCLVHCWHPAGGQQ